MIEKGLIKHGGHKIKTSGILFGTPKEFAEGFGSDMSPPTEFVLPTLDIIVKDGKGRVFVIKIDRFVIAY